MKNRSALLSAAFLMMLGLNVAAEAQVANFQGSTLGFSRNGDFQAIGSSCPDGKPTQFEWTFVEDRVARFGNPVTHRFTASFCAYTVILKITCPDGSTASSTRSACFECEVPGCILPDKGYN